MFHLCYCIVISLIIQTSFPEFHNVVIVDCVYFKNFDLHVILIYHAIAVTSYLRKGIPLLRLGITALRVIDRHSKYSLNLDKEKLQENFKLRHNVEKEHNHLGRILFTLHYPHRTHAYLCIDYTSLPEVCKRDF